MKKPLSESQAEVLDFVRRFIAENGYSPTFRDISAGCGFSSPNAAFSHMRALRRKGWIVWEHKRSRTVREVGVGA
jgi:repressor LexA